MSDDYHAIDKFPLGSDCSGGYVLESFGVVSRRDLYYSRGLFDDVKRETV